MHGLWTINLQIEGSTSCTVAAVCNLWGTSRVRLDVDKDNELLFFAWEHEIHSIGHSI